MQALIKQTWVEWQKDHGNRLAAALAFYSVLSLAPLLMVTIEITGGVFGDQTARGDLFKTSRSLMGHEAAAAINDYR